MCRNYRFVLILLLVCSFSGVLGQTKLIAHKSHSGNSSNFRLALKSGFYDLDNFGEAPDRRVKSSQLDSVVFVSDSVAVMFTSEYCKPLFHGKKDINKSSLWKAGSDTVIHHPLFSLQHELDSIKTSLKRHYYFKNNMDSVKFIGFDNNKMQFQPQQQQNQKQEFLPLAGGSQTSLFDDWIWMTLIVLLVSLLAGIISWKFVQPSRN